MWWKFDLLFTENFWISISPILRGHFTKEFYLALHTFQICSCPISQLTYSTFTEKTWDNPKYAWVPLINEPQSVWILFCSDQQHLSRGEIRSTQICQRSNNKKTMVYSNFLDLQLLHSQTIQDKRRWKKEVEKWTCELKSV